MQAVSPTTNAPAAREPAGLHGEPKKAIEVKAGARPGAPALHGAQHDWDARLNEQTAGAQQALAYLERLSAQLQVLKASLSAKLAAGTSGAPTAAPSDATLAGQVQSASATWQQRAAQAGGNLDSQLRFQPEGGARQEFRVRGLDASTLNGGERESLGFSLGTSSASVTLEAGASLAGNVRSIDRALAPIGIHARLDASGEPVFSVAEAAWPATRDSLAVKGGGVRFAGGQAHRVKAVAQPDAVTPSAWHASDAAGLRRSLQDVTQALDRIRDIIEQVRQALDRANAQSISASTTPDPAWAASFANDFGMRAQAPGYEVYAAVAPALASVNRSRVLSLLALK